jgi:hypothetical protein
MRSLNMLPPTPDEKPIQKTQRGFIWAAMILDFIAALISITTYDGATTCCNVPIFEIASANTNWDILFRIITYIYMTLIIIEILPVFQKGIPINLINPVLGFTITFAMFIDYHIREAVTMWVIEAIAVVFEVLVLRLKVQEFKEGEELVNAVQRERRRGRIAQSELLRYHYIGNIINCTLALLSVSLIIGTAKNGGLCIYHLQASIFDDGQSDLCSACTAHVVCQICDENPDGIEHQCYYPYW